MACTKLIEAAGNYLGARVRGALAIIRRYDEPRRFDR